MMKCNSFNVLAMYSPTAGSSVLLNTCTVKLVDNGLLRINVGCKCPLFSLILYTDSLKVKLVAEKFNITLHASYVASYSQAATTKSV